MFKKRGIKYEVKFTNCVYQGTLSIYSPIKQRLEFIHLKYFKFFLKRKSTRQRARFSRMYIWLGLYINIIFSMKSKNSRMGAGVGGFVRLGSILYKQTTVCILRGFIYYYILGFLKKLTCKVPLHLKVACKWFNLNFNY